MRLLTALLISLLFAASARAQMGPGPAAPGTAVACYNPATGEIIVSSNSVRIWYIDSATRSLTGEPPQFGLGGTLNTFNDSRVGQAAFGGTITFVDYNLGPVAATGLPLSDLILLTTTGFGEPEVEGVMLLCVPEPATSTAVGLLLAAGACRFPARKWLSMRR